jgi:DNA primase
MNFEAIREAVDIVAVAGLYTELNERSLNGPCPFCGGRDRFYVHVGRVRVGCRQECGWNEGRSSGDVIDLLSKAERISLQEAATLLTSSRFADFKPAVARSARPRKPKRPDGWDEKTENLLRGAVDCLASDKGEPGRRYLEYRGIRATTWKAFGVGFAPKTCDGWDDKAKQFTEFRPALWIPWFNEAGHVEALKYRFADELAQREHSRRFSQCWGSDGRLFGAHMLGERAALLAVEGEVNAMSCWQAMRLDGASSVDVVSVGSDSNGPAVEELTQVGGRYQAVLVWCDEPGKAARTLAKVKPSCSNSAAMQSPLGSDANDILREHGQAVLRDLITLKMPHVEPSGCVCPDGQRAEGIRRAICPGLTLGRVIDSRCPIHCKGAKSPPAKQVGVAA